MNEKQINAMIQTLIAQRDSNANAVVQMAGQIAILEDELKMLKEANDSNANDK